MNFLRYEFSFPTIFITLLLNSFDLDFTLTKYPTFECLSGLFNIMENSFEILFDPETQSVQQRVVSRRFDLEVKGLTYKVGSLTP